MVLFCFVYLLCYLGDGMTCAEINPSRTRNNVICISSHHKTANGDNCKSCQLVVAPPNLHESHDPENRTMRCDRGFTKNTNLFLG